MVASNIFGIVSLLAMIIANSFFITKKDHIAFLAGSIAMIASLFGTISTIFLGGISVIAYQIMQHIHDFWLGILLGTFFFLVIGIGPAVALMALGSKTKKEYFFLVSVFYASTLIHLFLL
jgi:hypothetical protein